MRTTIAAVSLWLAASTLCLAADGDLDPTFGLGGKVTTDLTPSGDRIVGIAAQPDGKVVAVGTAAEGPELDSSIALARYNPDGSLDATFGMGGIVVSNFGPDNDWASSLVLQPDGAIVVAGSVFLDSSSDAAIVRYRPDGALDPAFGAGGLVRIGAADEGEGAFAVALQADGRIVVLSGVGAFADARWMVARLHSDGTLDPSFGTGGIVTTDIGVNEAPFALTLQADGKILAGGHTQVGVNSGIALARYDASGALDPTFGAGGIVTTAIAGGHAGARELAILPGGKILVGGNAAGAGDPDFGDFLLARYESNGALDATFGTGGSVMTDVRGHTDSCHAMAVTASGKILLAGRAFGPTGSDFALLRFHADGTLDPSFGVGGKVVTDFLEGSDSAGDIALLGDGRMLLGGSAESIPGDFQSTEFALARYAPNQAPRCDLVLAEPGLLWPADRRVHDLALTVPDPDGDPVALTVTGITQDEPTSARPGDPSPDGFGVGTPVASVRAERDVRGNGRVYLVAFTAEDGRGASCSGTVAVAVPHHPGATAVDDGQVYDATAP